MTVQLGLRFLGAGLVILGASGLGIWMAGQYGKRLGELEQLRQMMVLLKGQIVYASSPLAEALETVGGRTEGALSGLFCDAAARLYRQEGETFCQIWKEEVKQLENPRQEMALTKEDRQCLAALGEHLGFLDREMQERNLLLYLEQLDIQIQAIRERKQERCRLCTSLGVMGGLFLAILLV